MTLRDDDNELERPTLDYARELHATAASLRDGAERLRLDKEVAGEMAERLGGQWTRRG